MDLLDYDLSHYIRLLYTGCPLDYALLFYRRTINFVYYFLLLLLYVCNGNDDCSQGENEQNYSK